PPPPPPPPPPAGERVTKLAASVGPGFSISLEKGARAAKTTKSGTYAITVRDRSAMHNFHLVGPGVNKRTAVGFVGTVSWKLRLEKGIYRFLCDPHARSMKGSFRVL
ncbi:MAG: hypothetical protein H0U03_05845, partial [Actinobacteria bacterium]|nr:hypothetical protein [Actinomycetota bacterium]